ncbi:hypothetical protein J6590_024971 [Homalodisca vitripennis]|nr:hypothetical protein J6590_024971 [Homalodisca vitripennis]
MSAISRALTVVTRYKYVIKGEQMRINSQLERTSSDVSFETVLFAPEQGCGDSGKSYVITIAALAITLPSPPTIITPSCYFTVVDP